MKLNHLILSDLALHITAVSTVRRSGPTPFSIVVNKDTQNLTLPLSNASDVAAADRLLAALSVAEPSAANPDRPVPEWEQSTSSVSHSRPKECAM